MGLRKEISDMFQAFKRAGVKWLMASGAPQQGMMAFEVVSGGTPDTVLFSDIYVEGEQLPNMATSSYVVVVNGETAGAVSVDQSSKTPFGFDILGGGAAEVLEVLVIGRIEGMPPING